MERSSWNPSLKTRPTTRSTGRRGAETSPCFPWASFAWSAVAQPPSWRRASRTSPTSTASTSTACHSRPAFTCWVWALAPSSSPPRPSCGGSGPSTSSGRWCTSRPRSGARRRPTLPPWSSPGSSRALPSARSNACRQPPSLRFSSSTSVPSGSASTPFCCSVERTSSHWSAPPSSSQWGGAGSSGMSRVPKEEVCPALTLPSP